MGMKGKYLTEIKVSPEAAKHDVVGQTGPLKLILKWTFTLAWNAWQVTVVQLCAFLFTNKTKKKNKLEMLSDWEQSARVQRMCRASIDLGLMTLIIINIDQIDMFLLKLLTLVTLTVKEKQFKWPSELSTQLSTIYSVPWTDDVG